jgi:hypothetical protein
MTIIANLEMNEILDIFLAGHVRSTREIHLKLREMKIKINRQKLLAHLVLYATKVNRGMSMFYWTRF